VETAGASSRPFLIRKKKKKKKKRTEIPLLNLAQRNQICRFFYFVGWLGAGGEDDK
jgi:hypothetical protein